VIITDRRDRVAESGRPVQESSCGRRRWRLGCGERVRAGEWNLPGAEGAPVPPGWVSSTGIYAAWPTTDVEAKDPASMRGARRIDSIAFGGEVHPTCSQSASS
jgi:hypothetical protein